MADLQMKLANKAADARRLMYVQWAIGEVTECGEVQM